MRGSSLTVHLGVLAAICPLLVIGAWVERFLFNVEAPAPAPAHRVALGQAGLLVYFYARSALAHAVGAPGVSWWELYLVGAGAGAHLLLTRSRSEATPPARAAAYALVWLAWWASALTYLGYRSGRLEPPASDPDLHTLWARLTAEHGRLIYDLLPLATRPLEYPSGFSALNAIWIDLTGAMPVAIVNCQIALQACLAVGLVVEMVFALRRCPALGISLLLIALAHAAFSFPVNAAMAYFEGAPRLSHTAMVLLPLTFAVRLSAAEPRSPGAGRAAWVVGAFCLGWAAALNPSHVLVAAPVLLAAALLVLPQLARGWRALIPAAAVMALLLASDAWIGPQLRALAHPHGEASHAPLQWAAALRAGLESSGTVSIAHVLPYRCIPSAQCPAFIHRAGALLAIPSLLLALVAVAARRKEVERAARAVLAIAVALWVTAFLAGFAPALFSAIPGLQGSLLQSYSQNGLTFSTALIFFALLAAGLVLAADLIGAAAARRWTMSASGADAAAGALALAACAVPVALHPEMRSELATAYSRNVHSAPLTALGPIAPEDVRVARAAARLVAPGEKVLLPGVVMQMNQWELWLFTLGGSRAIPLYTDVPFAFFHEGEAEAKDYRDHVCDRLDLAWLAERGIVWVYESAQVAGWACIHAWPEARARYFELKLRDGPAALWRLRTDLLAQARRDPVLGR